MRYGRRGTAVTPNLPKGRSVLVGAAPGEQASRFFAALSAEIELGEDDAGHELDDVPLAL